MAWDNQLSDRASNKTVHTLLDMCQAQLGEPLGFPDLAVADGRSVGQARGDLAGLTGMVKRHFGRKNWPVTIEWDGS